MAVSAIMDRSLDSDLDAIRINMRNVVKAVEQQLNLLTLRLLNSRTRLDEVEGK
jgi:hypothetical protein